MSVLNAAFFALAGICLYSAIAHLSMGWQLARSRHHLFFSGVMFLLVLFVVAQEIALQTQELDIFIVAHGCSLSLMLLAELGLLWFFASYTGDRARVPLCTISSGLLGAIALNILSPTTIQFSTIERLEPLTLPWGDTITRAVGTGNPWAYLMAVSWLASAVYILCVLARRATTRSMQVMLGAAWFYAIVGSYGMAIRVGLLSEFVPGALSLVGIVIIMEVGLHRDADRRQRDSQNRLQALIEQSPLGIQTLTPDGHDRR